VKTNQTRFLGFQPTTPVNSSSPSVVITVSQ
jgi:hypothetical protein